MSYLTRNLCALFCACAVMLNTEISHAIDLGCGFLECNGGCLVFRADDGSTYQFTAPPTLWRGAHRVHITGTVNPNCTPLCSGSSGCIQSPAITPCYATDGAIHTTADFNEGEYINLNASTDQLQINTWAQTKTADPPVLPYVWVALSGKGTVARIAAVNHYSPVDARCVVAGEVLGEYRTSPDECRGIFSDPSRTTVDFDGSVWVANRSDIQDDRLRYGHVVKVGAGLSYQWKDRDLPLYQGTDWNANGVLDTSTRLGDVRPWPNDGDGDCDDADVAQARDELILLYASIDGNTAPMGTRTVAVDRENHVWVGGRLNRWHEHIDGQTGASLSPGAQRACGGYGGLVDCNGVLWSAEGSGSEDYLLRFDPATAGSQCINVALSYGLAANTLGNVWNSKWQLNRASKLSSTGQVLLTTTSTAPNAIWYRGVVVTPDDNDVWTAATSDDLHGHPPYTVTRHTNDGTLRKIIDVEPSGGFGPTGVAVDSRGFVWVTNRSSHNLMRINPTGGADGLGAVDITTSLGAGALPYNYSDMTGVNLYHTISPAGVWTIVRDGGTAGIEWQSIAWTEVLGTGTVTVQARAANNAFDLGNQLYADVEDGICLNGSLVGRYVQVRVQLNAYCHDPDMPVLDSLFIRDTCPPGTIVATAPVDGTRDARQPHPPNDNSLGARQGIGSSNNYTGGPEPIVITLQNTGEPVRGATCPECWSLCETGIEQVEGIPPLDPNEIMSVDETSPGVYSILLDRPISAGHWTTISYLGGSSYVSYASLPGNSNGDGRVNVTDLGGLRAYILYGGSPPPYGIYGWDLDHNGVPQQADIDRWYDLYYGTSTFIPWGTATLPTNTCPGGGESASGAMAWSEFDAMSGAEYRLVFEEFASYLAGLIPATQEDVLRLWNLADAVLAWSAETLPSEQREEFAAILGEALPGFVSPMAAEVGEAIETGLKR